MSDARQQAYSRASYLRNRERKLEESRLRYQNDPEFRERIAARAKQRRIDNPEHVKSKIEEWRIANPERTNHYDSIRRHKKRADYKLLSREERDRVLALYRTARLLTKLNGEKYEVDHVVPLSMGGSHHPDNLIIMLQRLNRAKGARIIPRLNWFLEIERGY